VASSAGIGFVTKETVGYATAAILGGGGIAFGILTAYTVYRVSKKIKTVRKENKKILSEKKIEGVHNVEDAE